MRNELNWSIIGPSSAQDIGNGGPVVESDLLGGVRGQDGMGSRDQESGRNSQPIPREKGLKLTWIPMVVSDCKIPAKVSDGNGYATILVGYTLASRTWMTWTPWGMDDWDGRDTSRNPSPGDSPENPLVPQEALRMVDVLV